MLENISLIDICLILIVIVLGFKGYVNGLIKEIFGLAGIIGGIFFASRFGEAIGKIIETNIYPISSKEASFTIGFVVFLFSFWLVCFLLGLLFSKIIKFSGLESVNNILGFIVGSLKIFLVFAIFFALLIKVNFIKEKMDDFFANSKIYPMLTEIGSTIIKIDISSKESIPDIIKSLETAKMIEENTTNIKESIAEENNF